MGKLIIFPGAQVNQPTRADIVEEASSILMEEVTKVFNEQRVEYTAQHLWFRDIRDFLWRQEIQLNENQDFRFEDLHRWKNHWRGQALDYIRSLHHP